MVKARIKQESVIMDNTIKKITRGLNKIDADYVAEEVYRAQFF
jgi:hypothetical protein